MKLSVSSINLSPLKTGKQSQSKHLSKIAISETKYMQIIKKSYRHTGSEDDNAICKEALKEATTDIIKSKKP